MEPSCNVLKEIPADNMIASAFRWSNSTVWSSMYRMGKMYKTHRVAYGIKKSYGHKGLWDVDIVVRGSWMVTRHDLMLSTSCCSGLKRCWEYIKQLSNAMWFFTDNFKIDAKTAMYQIPTHLLFRLKDGQLAIIVNEFHTYIYEMRGITLTFVNYVGEKEVHGSAEKATG